ncbi:transcriptional regulator with XRE-family HTH domain [Erwinia toletana]|uniref:Transcriptional regulator with XRE-family HTH domain n=1 Tax=Winslowiella toletana TaxID=92490 RepID=A0ABS4PF51_9GAMM|nr:helix-turn-helix transcriptional regulator [Winslowiella toletana]MBP2170711.1 transcriptional regulator with XRE-family HTH domain [Winslowiella toletana]
MIGKRLRLARVNANLTQSELGRRAGMDGESASTRISQYERGTHAPDFKLVCKFAVVLDVPEAWFYAVDEDLAAMILQYHRYKKNNPGAGIVILPQ